MMYTIFAKTLFDRRYFIVGWGVGMFTLAVFMASFFPAMRPEGGLDVLLANMPAVFEGLIGDLADMREFDTFIASQLFDIRVPLIAGIMAIMLGLGLSTREEETGELKTVLSLPVSRSKLYWQKWLAMALVMDVAVGALIAGVYVVTPFIDDATIALWDVFWLGVMTWLIMTTFGSITYATGMATGRRAIASFVGIFVIMGSFILSTFAVAVDWLQDFEALSLLHYFPAVDVVESGVRGEDIVILAGVNVVFLLAGWWLFRRRDIA